MFPYPQARGHPQDCARQDRRFPCTGACQARTCRSLQFQPTNDPALCSKAINPTLAAPYTISTISFTSSKSMDTDIMSDYMLCGLQHWRLGCVFQIGENPSSTSTHRVQLTLPSCFLRMLAAWASISKLQTLHLLRLVHIILTRNPPLTGILSTFPILTHISCLLSIDAVFTNRHCWKCAASHS